MKIIIPILCLCICVSYKLFQSINNLHPFLNFMNLLLLNYCNNPPFYSNKEKLEIFPISKEIEDNYESIKKDYLNYKFPIQPFHEMLPEFVVGNKEDQIKNNKFWKILPLKTTGKIIQSTQPFFPSLSNILSNPIIHNAYFSILEAKVNIPPHTGPYRGYLRYHLGIIVPIENKRKPFIVVGNQKYHWKEGEGVLFDDMYEHYVENPTNHDRVVLFIDVIRPLNGIINWINKKAINLIENNPIMKNIQKIQHETVKL